MFNPTREQVRQFFTDAWTRHKAGGVLTPLETIAARIMELHPEYLSDLEDPEAEQRDYSVEDGRSNPFLHMSMHLAIQEQVSIDHPPGIRSAWERLSASRGPHEAEHVIMEALGQVIWEAQRSGTPPDNDKYLDLILRHTTRN
jgi:hypothetical protein